jgi:deoxyribodipyrimidine photo-lyase
VERLGGRLEIRRGEPATILPALAREHAATAVYVSRDYAPYGRRRDRAVRGALGAAGVEWHERAGVLTHEPEELRGAAGRAPRTFAAFHRRFRALPRRPVLGAPRRIPSPAAGADARRES